MGFSNEYADVPSWIAKPEGYQTGSMVKYKGNVFYANFWATEPGVGDADHNGWRFYDELYDQTSSHTTETKQAKIIVYIPTWRKKEGFNYVNDEMYQNITHGIISFLMFDETKLGEFEPNSINDVNAVLSEVVKTGHRNGAHILIALGGATDYGFLNLMTAIGKNPTNTNPLLIKAVQKVVDFVRSNNLDGVDLDLECWWGKPGESDQGGRPKGAGPHPAGYGLTLFAQSLKQAMPTRLVSAAVFGTSWYGNNYDPKMADHVDWLAIMTYDLTGSWNASPVGPHSALFKIRDQASARPTHKAFQESYLNEQQGSWPPARSGGTDSTPMVDNPILSVEDSLWYWTNPLFVNWQGAGQKVPRRKIAAGVPIYGYDFAYGKDPDDLSGQVPPGYKVLRYKDILAQFPIIAPTVANGNIKVSGSTPTPPFISPQGTYPFTNNIYFETPAMAVAKLQFLKEIGAQGVIIWELSNDVWEEGKSIIKALYKKSGNPAIKPPIRRYNQCSFLCTHNSFTNYEDARWTSANQSKSITNQLKNGVRALMLDTHYVEGDIANLVIHKSGVYLLHGVNERGWLPGFTFALPSQRLYHALYDVWAFLDDNPNEVVTIFLEDYTAAKELQAEFDFIAVKNGPGFLRRIYNPDKDSYWKVKERGEWPLLSDLIAWDKRVIIFSSNQNKQGSNYVAYDRDYTKQNYWSLGVDGTNWSCPSRWNDGEYEEAKDPDPNIATPAYPKLFVFNHHRDVPTTITAALDNYSEKILNRIDYQCTPRAKQLPNFVAVDFFEVPLERGRAQDAVNELNRRWQAN